MRVLVGLGQDVGEDADVAGVHVAADVVDHAAADVELVGDDDGQAGVDLPQVLQRSRVEVGVGGHPEPLRRRAPVGHRLDVHQVLVVDVVGRHRPSPRAAAQRESRRQAVVDAAESADGRGRVDQDPAGADRLRVGVHGGLVVGVDGRGVAQATVFGDQHGRVHGVLEVAGADEPEHGHELLLHQRMRCQFVQVARQLRHQDLVVLADAEPGALLQDGGRLAERHQVDLARAAEGELGDPVGLVLGHQPGAHPLELGDRLVVDLVVDDRGLLGGADHAVVERLGDQDVDHHHLDVGRLVHVHGRVAGSDAQ